MKALFLILSVFLCAIGFSQSPGLIIRPAGGNGVTLLNPNGDGYSSATTSGFTTNDITQSELPYKIVPPAITEPTGDIATGPSGGFTDIVKTVDGSGFYTYSDGTNLFLRLRIGSIISGSKGYSVMVDTDGKIGNSGSGADPNYIAATNTSNGNPGFEYEIILQTNFQVAVYNVDGSSNPGSPVNTYSLLTNSQISAALSTDGNNADYFYDWYVPLSAVGSPSSFRLAATTVTSPNSAFQGSRSDIYGIDDNSGTPADLWTSVVNAQPVMTVTSLQAAGTTTSPVCTAAPVVTGPINTGSNISVSGTWTRMDATKPVSASITLYKNGSAVSSTLVTTGNIWTISVPTVATNDVFYAKAQATGETQCLQSNSVIAGCTSIPVAPVISCASSKGITGTIPLGTTVNIYQVTTANQAPTTTQLSTGLVYATNASDQTFSYFGSNPQTGNACQGQNGILTINTTYMFVTNNGGCLSAPTFICITGSSQNSWAPIASNSITLTTPIYPFQNTVSGTGSASGQLLRLFVNDKYVTSVSATGIAFSFTGLTLNTGDVLKVYAQASSACMTVSSSFTVSCYTASPTITTNSAGSLLTSATSIPGKSSYTGATVTLYKGVSPSGTQAGTATVNASGNWTVTGLTLTAGDTYYAVVSNSGCTSPSSASATVAGVTSVCPTLSATTFLENVSSVGGTISSFSGIVRLYLDGVEIGSTSLTNGTSWSVPVNTLYSNTLYPGGVLTVTAQSTGNAESASCASTASVTCSPPLNPSASPLSSTINTGQTVTYAISNVTSGAWYSVTNSIGSSFAKSQYSLSSSNFNLTTSTFNNAGTYQLNITADKLTGCSQGSIQATVVVNNIITPVHFISIAAERINGRVNVSWRVENEADVVDYNVQASSNGIDFSDIGTVTYKHGNSAANTYSFDYSTDARNTLYFRIKQNDVDGNYMLSKIVSVSAIKDAISRISPNPSSGRFVLSQVSNSEQVAEIAVRSLEGKIVLRKTIVLRAGVNESTIQLSKVLPGIYYLTVSGKDLTVVHKLIVAGN
jgi:hypothetical protein